MFDIESRFRLMRTEFQTHQTKFFKQFIIRKEFLLEDGTDLFKSMLESNQDSGKDTIKIVFIDETGNYEAGIDQGGLYKDFISLYTQAIFDPNYGYFIELD